MKKTLGEARYNEWARMQDGDYKALTQMADRFDLPKETADKVYQMKQEAERLQQKIDSGEVALQFDAAAYYMSSLPNLAVPAYTRLDARLGYRPRQDLEISLSGQNLQGGRHAEFISDGPYPRVTIGRSVMVTLTWGF